MSRPRTIRFNIRSPEVSKYSDQPTVTLSATRKLRSGRYEEVKLELRTCGWNALAGFIEQARAAAKIYVDSERSRIDDIASKMGVES